MPGTQKGQKAVYALDEVDKEKTINDCQWSLVGAATDEKIPSRALWGEEQEAEVKQIP